MNGRTFLIYTTEVGGRFKCFGTCSREAYDEIKLTGKFNKAAPIHEPDIVEPTLVVLARIEDNFDFTLGSSREDALLARSGK